MKLSYFYGTIIIKTDKNGYEQSLQFDASNNNGKLEFNYPYGRMTPEEAAAVSSFTKTVTDAYNKLQKQIDTTNKDLQLEQYAIAILPTAGSDFDIDAESASSQLAGRPEGSNALPESTLVDAGDKLEEVETGEDMG